MISTSSSECDCTGSFGFSTTLPNFLGNPFCPTIRQPLIYYAKIEEPIHHHLNTGNMKYNSNYFTKAFQWYTQERGSGYGNEIANSKGNHNDFASWLDKKYSEYLKRSETDGSAGLLLKQSLHSKGDKMSKKQKCTKKFGRMRSPWKRRRSGKDDDVIPPVAQSIEYIMLQPKEILKPASERCQRNSRIQSSTTIISKDSPKYTKFKVKSKSLLSIYRAPGACENKEGETKSHAKIICECLNIDKGTQYETWSLEALRTPRNNNLTTQRVEETDMSNVIEKTYSPKTFSRSNVLCQCSEVNLNEADGALPLRKYETREDGHSNDEYISVTKNSDPLENQAYNSKMIKMSVNFNDNSAINITKLQNCYAQTSDHSINFDNVVGERPLLLKILNLNK